LIGDSSASHAFSFVPDVVAGLAALGESGAEGVFHLPMVQVPPQTLIKSLATAVGSSAGAYTLPAWAVRFLGIVVPLFGELRETLYQWERPFYADDTKFRQRFPQLGTALEAAARMTMG